MSTQAFLSETRERFLKAILAQLPVERIRELYVFPPIKQGGVESGVAVIAAYPEPPSAVGRPPSAEDATDQGPTEPDEQDAIVPLAEPPTVPVEAVTGEVAESEGCEVPQGAEAADAAGDAVTADGRLPAPDEAPTPDAPPPKYTVYTARYRHVLKGPDRGRWEASVVAEADAPLISIESVVRGVQRRSGDVEGPDHMSADDLRAALRLAPSQ